MSKNLVIVESPAKAKTIEKFLGKDFKVVSSNGHIADLPSKELGINIDNNYEPKYIVNSDKKDIVRKLKKESKSEISVMVHEKMPNSQIYLTNNLGHRKLLGNADVIQRIADFI